MIVWQPWRCCWQPGIAPAQHPWNNSELQLINTVTRQQISRQMSPTKQHKPLNSCGSQTHQLLGPGLG